MKALEYIKNYKKGFVFEQYTRIIANFKEYEKITKVKMLEALYKKYGNPEGIISICTERELKYLKLVCVKNKEYLNDKYNWERTTLRKKFIIYDDFDSVEIYEELQDAVNIALKNIDWKQVKENDRINEFLVSFCKIQGTILVESLIQISAALLGVKDTVIRYHILNNRLFKFYVSLELITLESIGEQVEAIYNDYYHLKDELAEERKKQGIRVSELAKKVGAIDYPSDRRVNKRPIPRIGGLAVIAGFLVSAVYLIITMIFLI